MYKTRRESVFIGLTLNFSLTNSRCKAEKGNFEGETAMVKKFAILLSVALIVNVAQADIVYFADENLEAAVCFKLGISPPVTEAEMLNLSHLLADGQNINELTGLEYATNLISLRLYSNQITHLSSLSGLMNLDDLYLGYNQITDTSTLSGLANLGSLDLSGNPISNFSGLSGLSGLWLLALCGNQISDIPDLSGLTTLHQLYLGANEISDISALWNLAQLSYLYLDNNQISDISALSGLTNLEYLDLRSNPLNNDAYNIFIPQILENNPGIEVHYDPIPEPGTILLLGLGSLALLKKRKA